MASLEAHLSELLSAYRSAHKSLPQDSFISVSGTCGSADSNAGSYTAPSDGFFVLSIQANAAFVVRVAGKDWFVAEGTGRWKSCFIPMRKGQTATFGNLATDSINYWIRFYPVVGA